MKPNLILINCDDLGVGDLGCYGSQVNQTPALDRLAREGTRFTDFSMASSICTPSRAGMLTGCYPQRISMNRVLFPGDAEGLHPEEETIASMLKRSGYETALVGKWHLGDQPEFLPHNFGFDQYFGLPFSNDMGRQVGDPPDKPPLPLLRDNQVIEEQPEQSGLTARYVEQSIDFMRASQGRQRPFFLYLAHMYVHLPLYVPEAFLSKSRNGRYGGAVACIDWAWDELEKELGRLGIKENTIVIFTSDNGSRAGGEGGSNAPFKGGKFTTWEGGFRLPLIARWPGHVPADQVCPEPVTSLDLLPTIAALTGAEPDPRGVIDGLDCSELLKGKGTSPRDTFAYFAAGNLAAIRHGRWKLHFCRRTTWGQPFAECSELYDLEADPGESENLVGSRPEVEAKLEELAEQFRHELGDNFTGQPGESVRPCGSCAEPVPLVPHHEDNAYVVAEYDLADRG